MNAAGIVLQARMGSRRLPGKVLAPLGGEPLVARCVERLRLASGLPVILATTLGPEDDVLCAWAAAANVPVVRGPSDDVLARYVLAALTHHLAVVVRATADNPAVDPEAPLRTVDALCRTGVDYVTEVGLPVGSAVEACTTAALRLAHATTGAPYDREHVTPFLRRDRRVTSLDLLAPAALRRPDVRLTVDRAEDLARMRDIYDVLGARAVRAPLSAFIAAADAERARRLLREAGAR
jgi:spore coat polysaccharide biosynthesis protein SpsF